MLLTKAFRNNYNIKRDQEQACEVNQCNVSHLEKQLELALKESKEAHLSTSQSIQKINQAASSNKKEIESIQDRVSYLRRVVLSNRNDSNNFIKELENIQQLEIKHKDQYQKDLEKQKSQQQEMENDFKILISTALHQLKTLRFLQELRIQLDQQTRAVRQLIEEEKRLNSDDLTNIRHQILDQREFYENDLQIRLDEAKKFAKDFSDLHMEMAATKIMTETIQNRKQLQEESTRIIGYLGENESLRKKHHLLDQDFKILQKSVEKLHSEYSTLKLSVVKYEEKLYDTLNQNKDQLRQYRDEKDDQIGELKLRREEALQRREQLNQELVLAQRELLKAENGRSESSQREFEVLDKMSQSATFILTAIDKNIASESIQNEEDTPSIYNQISSQDNNAVNLFSKTNASNLKLSKNDQDISQKSELSKLMLRLQNISKQMKAQAIQSKSVIQNSKVEKKDEETQTEKSTKFGLLSTKIQPPSLLEKTQSPRKKAYIHTLNRSPRAYKKLYSISMVPMSKNRVPLVRSSHV